MTDEHEHEHHHTHDYAQAVEQERHEVAHYYADHFDWRGHEPPADWAGPQYYPTSEKWRLDAWLDKDAPGTGDHIQLATSTGKLRDMTVAGQLVFEVDGREHRLNGYRRHGHEHDEEEQLFVPFQDATSGRETYGAGRYLDLPPAEDDGIYDLDFNFAYNPSCAYSPVYDCPYPPKGNRLNIRVDAGEKVPFPGQLAH